MRTEKALLGVVVVAVLVSAVVAVGVPGAIDPTEDQPPDREPPAHVDIVELTISSGAVGGENATIHATPYLRQRGGTARNVTVVLRAVDEDTGFVTATDQLSFGTLDGDIEANRSGSLTVKREGDYDVEAVVYVNGSRVTVGSRTVQGVGELTPAYRDSPLQFQAFDAGMPVIEYRIDAVENNRSTLAVSTYLTNTGDRSVGDLELVLTARQNGSNVIADRTTIQVDDVGSGKTVTPSGDLVVPDDYNYYLDAVLWRDGTVVATARSTANLAPGTGLTVDENTSGSGDGLESSDFVKEDADESDPSGEPTEGPPTAERESGGTPGFGLVPGVVALLALLAVARFARTDA